MGSKRTMVLVAAIVIAALAGVATFSYLNGVQERANNGAALTKVFMVKKDITRGLPAEQAISQGYVKADQIQERFRPATSVTDLDAIKNMVAVTNLSANQVLVDGQFVDPKVSQVTNAQRVPPGWVAVTVSVDQVRGVAGLLVPGDKVNMLVTTKDPGPAATSHVRYLYQNVDVLFIGNSAAPQPGETKPNGSTANGNQTQNSNLITFSVPPLAAEKIVYAATTGGGSGLYLTLVPPDNKPAPVPPVGDAELLQGGLTPYEG